MTETDPLKQLAQLEGYNTIRSDHVRQMQLLRYWADELATPRYADPKRLLRYGFKTYSQSDEDGIIQEIFKRVGTGNRIFVEFGVESGVECNSVKLLVEGWRGLWLEGSATRITQIHKNFQTFLDERRLAVNEAFVAAENINALLEAEAASPARSIFSASISTTTTTGSGKRSAMISRRGRFRAAVDNEYNAVGAGGPPLRRWSFPSASG